jgi:hypothetical protein
MSTWDSCVSMTSTGRACNIELVELDLSIDAVFYLWFEAFPLVFIDIYHFNLSLSGLPFLAFIVTGVITVSLVLICY